ncbi:MAG: thioredoxin domain-containing protein, partial [Chitinophagaceae bacterium]
KETLQGVLSAFRDRRNEIDAQAENLTAHLVQSNSFGMLRSGEEDFFTPEKPEEVFQQILKQSDREWGGFGRAPKFPQTGSIQYLLRFFHLTGNREALDQALLSLDKMIQGGIYDQLGGGFARYSTDTEWLAPHFEKMLYDNALLISVLSEAYLLTRKERYRVVIEETMAFIQREMMHPGGGFYAAIDADSEGVEGKFYVWDYTDVKNLLGGDAELFVRYYDITERGNWEHTNILRVKKPFDEFARENGISEDDLNSLLERGRQKLWLQREKRIRPLLDDKIILGWNALMNSATSKAFAATGKEEYRELAIANMDFLWRVFYSPTENSFLHTWKEEQARFPAFLDDLAFLAEALINLQEITADTRWLVRAREVTSVVQELYREEDSPFFFYTPRGQEDIIVRKKEVYDGALPSGNAVMAGNLHRLGILFDIPAWRKQATEMAASLGNAIVRYPTSFGYWACLLQELIAGTYEIAILGKGVDGALRETLQHYIPHRVLMGATDPVKDFPLLDGRGTTEGVSIYLCSNYTCQLPVFSANELISLINKGQKQ